MRALKALFLKHGKSLRVRSEETIFNRGTKVRHAWFVKSGRVLLHSSSLWGREIGFEIIRDGGIFGIAGALDGSRAVIDATAVNDCDLLCVDKELFISAMRTDAGVNAETFAFLCKMLIRRTKQAEELALHSLRGRLARYLLALAQEEQGESHSQTVIRLDSSQRLLASMAGVSRETLNRQFKNWIKSGIIALEGKQLHILKPEVLRDFSGAAHDR